MIVKRNLVKTLSFLEKRYNGALLSTNLLEPMYFSKLATLELCGWIEESLDQIIMRSVKGRLKTHDYQQLLQIRIINNTSGFEYKKYFRPMLLMTVGLVNTEKIELKLKKDNVFDHLVSELETISKIRNDAAHTWINGTTKSYPAPSYVKAKLDMLYPIVRSIYSEAIKINNNYK